MSDEGRIVPAQVPAEAISFFGGGGMKPKHFYDHEIMEIVERGYVRLYENWGACFFRQWKVCLNGYEYCSSHSDPVIRRRAKFHRAMAAEMYPLTRAMEIHAPNTTVRKLVRDQRARYEKLIGPPNMPQRLREKLVISAARKATRREIDQPINLYPKVEPYKRYDYHRRGANGDCPYTVTHPRRELSFRVYDLNRRVRLAAVSGASKAFLAAHKYLHKIVHRGRCVRD